jgi:acyl-CoA thioesterase
MLAAFEIVLAQFAMHSIHSQFLNAVSIHTLVVYDVERVRGATSFVTHII